MGLDNKDSLNSGVKLSVALFCVLGTNNLDVDKRRRGLYLHVTQENAKMILRNHRLSPVGHLHKSLGIHFPHQRIGAKVVLRAI